MGQHHGANAAFHRKGSDQMTHFDELAAPQLVRQHRAGKQAGAPAAGSTIPPGSASILHLQRTAGNAAVLAQMTQDADPERPITGVVSGGGQPLDGATLAGMEQAFGHDFSDVRIHDDSAASDAARDVSAKAATVGNHIVFRSGEFNPGTPAGNHILAHELTHVVQQRSGPVDGTAAGGGVKISDPSDRFETAAEANASRIAAQLSAASEVQRDDVEGDDEVQALADASVQREGEEDEADEEESEA
jgi:hypothetical protein